MCKKKDIIIFIGIIIIGVVSVIVTAFLCVNFMCSLGIANAMLGKIMLTWISMLTGFCIIPTYILMKIYEFKMCDLGVGSISKIEKNVILLVVGMTVFYLITERNICNITILGITLLQNLVVAISEEFFSKGILFFVIKKITDNKIIIVLICSCVFAFVFHSSDAFFVNLTYRFPMAIILGICYLKTNNLYLPIILHLVNNLLATSMLK